MAQRACLTAMRGTPRVVFQFQSEPRMHCGQRAMNDMNASRAVGIGLTIVVLLTVVPADAADRQAAMRGIQKETAAIEQNPRNVDAYIRRALHHLDLVRDGERLRHVQAATQDLELAIQLEPKNFSARHNYGHASLIGGRHGIAIREFTQAIELNPKSAESYMERGWAHLYLGKEGPAQADFDKALALNPGLRSKLMAHALQIRKERAERQAGPHVPEQTGGQRSSRP